MTYRFVAKGQYIQSLNNSNDIVFECGLPINNIVITVPSSTQNNDK